MVETISQKEEQILQIAMQVFVEKGWHGARMQEIADRAGINKAMLHYYFRSKERLYTAVLEKLFLKFVNSIGDSFIPGQTFAETLRIFLDRFHEHLLNNGHLPYSSPANSAKAEAGRGRSWKKSLPKTGCTRLTPSLTN
ncbi:TetR/AcrR family transcriptional regulator [Calditrichota bacterium LG25]